MAKKILAIALSLAFVFAFGVAVSANPTECYCETPTIDNPLYVAGADPTIPNPDYVPGAPALIDCGTCADCLATDPCAAQIPNPDYGLPATIPNPAYPATIPNPAYPGTECSYCAAQSGSPSGPSTPGSGSDNGTDAEPTPSFWSQFGPAWGWATLGAWVTMIVAVVIAYFVQR